jgi:hypothetical protein
MSTLETSVCILARIYVRKSVWSFVSDSVWNSCTGTFYDYVVIRSSVPVSNSSAGAVNYNINKIIETLCN